MAPWWSRPTAEGSEPGPEKDAGPAAGAAAPVPQPMTPPASASSPAPAVPSTPQLPLLPPVEPAIPEVGSPTVASGATAAPRPASEPTPLTGEGEELPGDEAGGDEPAVATGA